jgi:hypothetical protein
MLFLLVALQPDETLQKMASSPLSCNSGDDRRFPEPILTDICDVPSLEVVFVLLSQVGFCCG